MRGIITPPFAPALMESTRSIGYSLEAAIADIIDNSLAAKASRIDIDFFPIGEAYVSIADNGIGMTEDELISAMEYGCRNPNDERDSTDLGRYGLGLKTASLSQCSCLTVVSVKSGCISGCRWDLDHVYETKDWDLLVLEECDFEAIPNYEKIRSRMNGTLVVWQNLDKMKNGEIDFTSSFGQKMDMVREHIALVFHRYLSGEGGLKRVTMYINEGKIEPNDPFLIMKSTQVMADENYYIRGQKIAIRAFTLPHISKLSDKEIRSLGGAEGLRKKQGFYVYRNKRLLVWGTWFRLMRQSDLSKLARVQVDIPNSLDDLWTLDIKKSTAIPPEAIRKNLSNVIERIAESSRRTWTHRGKKEIDDTKIHLWNRLKSRDEGIIYEINKNHPLVEKFIELYPKSKALLVSLLQQIEYNIPLNSLYIDLTNDEKITNETAIGESDTLELLRATLMQYPSNVRADIYEKLKDVEPFCNYLEAIQSAHNKGAIV